MPFHTGRVGMCSFPRQKSAVRFFDAWAAHNSDPQISQMYARRSAPAVIGTSAQAIARGGSGTYKAVSRGRSGPTTSRRRCTLRGREWTAADGDRSQATGHEPRVLPRRRRGIDDVHERADSSPTTRPANWAWSDLVDIFRKTNPMSTMARKQADLRVGDLTMTAIKIGRPAPRAAVSFASAGGSRAPRCAWMRASLSA